MAVAAFCIGTNQIDLDAAAAEGVAVFNAPYSNTRSVVELAVGLTIALMRDVADKSAAMHRGEWNKSADRLARAARQDPGHRRLRRHRLAAVGAGRGPGHAGGLPRPDRAAGAGQRPPHVARWTPCWPRADVVSLHVDGRTDNTALIDAARCRG